MLRTYVADLHVHTLLSPCASVEMTPHYLVLQAQTAGIDILAITDHNACDNVPAALAAAAGTGITILPGMEVETKEEVHIVVLFDQLEQLFRWEKVVDQHRIGRKNDEKKLGAQFVVDCHDEFLKIKEEMLLAALTLSVSEVVEEVHRLGGICIAAHVDRPVYSILAQLGFIPDDLLLEAVELSRRTTVSEAIEKFPAIGNLPITRASDAHTLEDFIAGPRTRFLLKEPCIAEIKLALAGSRQRKIM